MTRIVPLVVLVAVAAGVVALTTGGSGTTHATIRPSAPRPTVNVRSTPLGRILVNADGSTLYLFEADKPNQSNCTGACVSAWPPLISDATPTAAAGAQADKLGTIATAGGRRQVTYDGHPLYLYVGDQTPGDTKGQGLDQFGAEWYVLSPSGNKIDEG